MSGCAACVQVGPLTGRTKGIFFYFLIKFFAKFIHGTENFCNFVVGNHEYIHLFDSESQRIITYKGANNISDYQLFKQLSYPELR